MKNRLTSIADHSDYLSASTYSDYEKWQLHRKRVAFGKQTLEIWKFVPCKIVDGVWVVLEKPIFKGSVSKFKNDSFNYDEYWIKANNDYEEAKDRVLFEGFKIKTHANKNISITDSLEVVNIFWNIDNTYWEVSFDVKKLECLVRYNLSLTPTALKQIGYE